MNQKFETLIIEEKEHGYNVIINRPDVLNALNSQVILEFTEFLSHTVPGSNARAIVITGAGDKAFVAGADIAEMRDLNPSEARRFAERGQQVTRIIESLPQVTIARVNGFALGGGCELAMACDFIVTADTSKFGQPEVNLGLIPGFGGTQRLVRRIGLPMAMEVLCAGRHLSGTEAFQCGLASRVCPQADLDEELNKVLKKIMKTGPEAVALTKHLTRNAYAMDLAAGLSAEAAGFATCFAGAEASEGMSAFLEKRRASFAK